MSIWPVARQTLGRSPYLRTMFENMVYCPAHAEGESGSECPCFFLHWVWNGFATNKFQKNRHQTLDGFPTMNASCSLNAALIPYQHFTGPKPINQTRYARTYQPVHSIRMRISTRTSILNRISKQMLHHATVLRHVGSLLWWRVRVYERMYACIGVLVYVCTGVSMCGACICWCKRCTNPATPLPRWRAENNSLSPVYPKRIKTPAHSMGLTRVIRGRVMVG